ncbi:MAG TPA: hypothetical protein VFL71_20530 [Actinomycetes bacterium]|nr:hypothetical protein [Actinomycetes bacterium]
MDVAALIAWVVTAGGGFVLLGTWIARGGPRQAQAGASRFPPALIFGHFALAATGLVVWIIYVATGTEALAWVALVLLLGVAVLGLTMVTRWRQERAALAVAAGGSPAGAERPAEQHFPVPVVYLHGLLAVTTVVLVLLAALGVGGS